MKNKITIALFYISIVFVILLIILLRYEFEVPNILNGILFFAGLAALPIGFISLDMINENKINNGKIKKAKFFNIIKNEILDDSELKKMFRRVKIFSPLLCFFISFFIYCYASTVFNKASYEVLEKYELSFENICMELLKYVLILLCIFSIFYYLKMTKKIDKYIKELVNKKIYSDYNLISIHSDTIDIKKYIELYCDEIQLSNYTYDILDIFKFVDNDQMLVHLRINKHIHVKKIVPSSVSIFEGMILIIPSNHSTPKFFYQTGNLEVMTINNKTTYIDKKLSENINILKEKYEKDIRLFSCNDNTIYISCRQPFFSSDNDTKKKLQYKIVDYYYGIKCLIEASKLIDIF